MDAPYESIDTYAGIGVPYPAEGGTSPGPVGRNGQAENTMPGSRHGPRRDTHSHPRIVRRSGVWGGKAVVDGTRIPVFLLADRLESGWDEARVLAEYPSLTSDDVRAVMEYANAFPAQVRADRRAYEQAVPTQGA